MLRLVPLHAAALPRVLEWRTSPAVTRWMLTDIKADPDEQRRWFERIQTDPTCRHWLVRLKNLDVGLASLTDIDEEARSCSCGFYIGEETARRLGGVVLPGLVNYVFGELEFETITGEVMDGNTNVLKMHRLLGYRHVKTLKDHVRKYGQLFDLLIFELTRDEWKQNAPLFRPYILPVEKEGGK